MPSEDAVVDWPTGEQSSQFLQDYLNAHQPVPPTDEALRAQRLADYNAFDPTAGEFGAATTRSLIGLGESAAGLGEVGSKAIPFAGKYLQSQFKGLGDYLQETASAIPARVGSLKNISSPGDAVDYSEEQVGNIVGFLAPTIVLGLLSGGTSTELQLAQALGKSTAGEMSLGVSRAMADRLIQGGFIGSEIGSTFRDIRDETGQEAPLTSIVAGTASGLLLNSGASKVVHDWLEGSPQIRHEFLAGYMGDVLSTMARHGLFMAGAGAGSQAIHIAANKFADHSYKVATPANLMRITDAFVGGFIGAGAVAGAGRAVRARFGGDEAAVTEAGPTEQAPSFDESYGGAPLPQYSNLGDRMPEQPAHLPVQFAEEVAHQMALSRAAQETAAESVRAAVESTVANKVAEDINQQIVENPSKPIQLPKEETNAISKRGAETLPVQEAPGHSEAVVEGVRNAKEPAVSQVEAAAPKEAAVAPAAPPPEAPPLNKRALANLLKTATAAAKAIPKMGSDELALFTQEFPKRIAKFREQLPDSEVAPVAGRIGQLVDARTQEIAPRQEKGLLLDAKGNVLDATFTRAPSGQIRLLDPDGNLAYLSKRKFSTMAEFDQAKTALIEDTDQWSRAKRSTSWLAHDAPYGVSQEHNPEVWRDNMLARLAQAKPELAGTLRDLLHGGTISMDELSSLVNGSGKEKAGSMTPPKFAEALPEAIRTAAAKEGAGLEASESPEELKQQRAALLSGVSDLNPESVRQWLSSTPLTGAAEGQRQASRTTAGEAALPEAAKPVLSEGDQLVEKIFSQFGDDAGELSARVHNPLPGYDVGRDEFIQKVGPLIAQAKGIAPDKAAVFADALYRMLDESRQAGRYYGQLDQGKDHVPQTSRENPLPHFSAKGMDNIMALVNDPKVGFSPALRAYTARFFEHFRNFPEYFDHLTLDAVSRIDADGNSNIEYSGTFEPLLRLAKVAINSRNPDVIAHETSHLLYFFLPDEMRLAVEKEWRGELERAIGREKNPFNEWRLRQALRAGGLYGNKTYGMLESTKVPVEVVGPDGKSYRATFDGYQDMRPIGRGMQPQFTALEDIPGVTTKDSTTYGSSLEGKGYTVKDLPARGSIADSEFKRIYHLLSPEEYFVKRLLERTNGTVWDYARDFIRKIANVFKQFVGLDANDLWDRIVDGFETGKFQDRYNHWAAQKMNLDAEMLGPEFFGSLAASGKQLEKNVDANYTQELKRREYISAFAQNIGLKTTMERVADAMRKTGNYVSGLAERYAGLKGSVEVVARSAEHTDSKTFLRLMADPSIADRDKDYLARDYALRLRKLEQLSANLEARAKAWEKAFAEDKFQRKIGRLSDLKKNLDLLKEEGTDKIKTIIESTIERNQEDLKSRAAAEGASAEINREIAFWEKAKENRAGIGQLMDHITQVVSLTPEGRLALMGEGELTAQQILHQYEAITGLIESARAENIHLAVTDPSGESYLDAGRMRKLESATNNLVRQQRGMYEVASEMIARLRNLSRDLVVTHLLAGDPEAYTDFVGQYGPKYLDQLQKDPRKFAEVMAGKLAGAATKEGVMLHAIGMLNKDIQRSLTHYSAVTQARGLVDGTLGEPGERAAYKTALDRITPEGAEATPPINLGDFAAGDDSRNVDAKGNILSERGIAVPDGKGGYEFVNVDLSLGEDGLKDQQKELDGAVQKITDYLGTDAGQTDPHRRFWESQHKQLTGLLNANEVLSTNPIKTPVGRGLGILRDTARIIGTVHANLMEVLGKNLDAADDAARVWIQKDAKKIITAIHLAAQSHPELVSAGKTPAERADVWYNEIGNNLFGGANALGLKPAVGDFVKPGSAITAQDLAALEKMSEITSQLYKSNPTVNRERVMSPQTLREPINSRPGGYVVRKAIQTVEHTLPRSFRRIGIWFARENIKIGREAAPDKLSDAQVGELTGLYDGYLHDMIYAFMRDRNPNFASGEFSPVTYRAAAEAIRTGEAKKFDDLIPIFQTDKAGVDKDASAIRKTLTQSIYNEAMRVREATSGADLNPNAKIIWLQSQNSFTSPRRQPIANYGYYDYGLRNDAQVINFSVDSVSYWFDKLHESMRATSADLKSKLDTLRVQAHNKLSGDQAARARELERQIKSLDGTMASMEESQGLGGRRAAIDWHFGRRILGIATGSAIGNSVTTLKNEFGNMVRLGLLHGAISRLRVLKPDWAWQYGREALGTALVVARGALGAPFAAVRAYGEAKEHRAREAFLAAVDEFANQTWLRDLSIGQYNATEPYQQMSREGWFPYYSIDHLRNLIAMPQTGGAIYRPRYDTSTYGGKLLNAFNTGLSYLGLFASELPNTIFPRGGDLASNAGLMNFTANFANRLRLDAARTFKALGDDAIKSNFKLGQPGSLENKVTPEMLLGRGATNSNLSILQELFRSAGLGISEKVVDYWRRLSETPEGQRDQVEFLKPNEIAALQKVMVEEINKSTRTNRAAALHNTPLGRVILPLMGWSWSATSQINRWFGRATADTKRSAAQLRYLQFVTIAGMVGLATSGDLIQEELLRRLYRWMFGEERPGRQPWEADSTWAASKRLILSASTIVPALAVVPNVMFNDTPAAASQGTDLFVQGKIKDLLSYIGGALSTGDWTYRLPEFAARNFPFFRPVINRIPGYSGVVELRSQTRLLQRFAPEDMIRPSQGGFAGLSSTATPLTPYGRRLVDAAMTGDWESFSQIYSEAVQKAAEIGRPNPVQAVQQLYQSQNPVRVALKTEPDAAQFQTILDRMPADQRQAFLDSMAKYQAGAAALGTTANLFTTATASGGSRTVASIAPVLSPLPPPQSTATEPVSTAGPPGAGTSASAGPIQPVAASAGSRRRMGSGRFRVRVAGAGPSASRSRIGRLPGAGFSQGRSIGQGSIRSLRLRGPRLRRLRL